MSTLAQGSDTVCPTGCGEPVAEAAAGGGVEAPGEIRLFSGLDVKRLQGLVSLKT